MNTSLDANGIDEKNEISCARCGKTQVLPPPKKRPILSRLIRMQRIQPERTKVVCDCSSEFTYWEKLESRKKSSPTGIRRFCTYLKIPGLISQKSVKAGNSFEIHCPICGKTLVLPPPKPFSKKGQFRPIRTDAKCDICGGEFAYWGRLETRVGYSGAGNRRYCLYIKIPHLLVQRRLRQYRLDVEGKWFKAPTS